MLEEDCAYTSWTNASTCKTRCGNCTLEQERQVSSNLPDDWKDICLLTNTTMYEITEGCPGEYVS